MNHIHKTMTNTIGEINQEILDASPASGLVVGYVVECYSTFIVNEVNALRRLGAQVVALSAFRPIPEADPLKESLRRESLYLPDSLFEIILGFTLTALTQPFTAIKLALFLRRQGESLRLLFLGAHFAQVARRSGIGHIHGTFGTRTTTLAHVISRLTGVGYSFTTHAYDIFRRNPSIVWKTVEADFMRTISHFNKTYICEEYGLELRDKIRVVHLGADVKIFAPVPRVRSHGDRLTIVSVGSLILQKGHLYLCRACAELSRRGINYRCEIIGEGPSRDEIRREIDRLGLSDQILLRGALSNEEVRCTLAASDIFCLACVDMRQQNEHIDGIPVALMEAMAMGLPTVASNISGMPELIEDGLSGLLVPQADKIALADALERLIRQDSLRVELGLHSRQRVEDHFDVLKNTFALARLFMSQTESPKP